MVGTLPQRLHRLFWDVNPLEVRLPEHADYVIERLMTRGDWDAMRWLRGAFEREALADFLARKGDRLPERERAYWALLATGDTEAAMPGGGRPSWAGT